MKKIAYLFILLCFISCENKSKRTYYVPSDLSVMCLGVPVEGKELFTPKKVKIIACFTQFSKESLQDRNMQDFMLAIERYKDNKDVVFLFYLSPKNKDFTEMEHFLKEINFAYPVIYDVDSEFQNRNYKKVYSFICEIFDINNRYVDTDNPSRGHSFYATIDKLLN